MFHPAEDEMARREGYHMQRGAVHGMGMMLRMEEQQMLAMQMREMEMMQMQAMGCAPSYPDNQWASPQPQQQQGNTESIAKPSEAESVPATTPSLAAQSPAAPAGHVSISSRSATKPAHSGDANRTPPPTTTTSGGAGLPDTPSQVGAYCAYTPNSLYNTMPSTNNTKDLAAAQESTYNGSSMYGDSHSAYAPAFTGGGLSENGASGVGYSMYNATNSSSMYEQPAPSSGATDSSTVKNATAADIPASGNSSKAATPALQHRSPGTSVSPALQHKLSVNTLEKKGSLAGMNGTDKSSTSTTHRSREIRQKNSELKRENSSGFIGGRSRGSFSRPPPQEKSASPSVDKDKRSPSSSAPKNSQPLSPSVDKDKSMHRSSSSSSDKGKGGRRY
ncbi:hypothetical protein Q4I32_006343 [Leishmania shawi]|uniref:Uncharacterized protein n=2 Tax=Viannia TaxID=37616 RepID=A0AAW3BE01_9TRYP